MRFILFLLAILALVVGIGILAAARSAIHEIEGFIILLISAVLLIGAAVVDAIHELRQPDRITRERSASEIASAPIQ